MSRNHCVGAVTKSVQAIDRDAKVDIDLAAKKVRVDSKAQLDEIAAAVEGTGYSVTGSSAT